MAGTHHQYKGRSRVAITVNLQNPSSSVRQPIQPTTNINHNLNNNNSVLYPLLPKNQSGVTTTRSSSATNRNVVTTTRTVFMRTTSDDLNCNDPSTKRPEVTSSRRPIYTRTASDEKNHNVPLRPLMPVGCGVFTKGRKSRATPSVAQVRFPIFLSCRGT
jgi:hypothetical protein